MSKVRNDFLFIKSNNEVQQQDDLYSQQRKHLKTHSLKDTLTKPLEKIKHENQIIEANEQ